MITAPKDDFSDAELRVSEPHTWAVGLPAIEHALLPELGDLGALRTAEVSFAINHKKGFDCPSCAWANPDRSKPLEFCENGAKSIVWEATPLVVPRAFWAEHSLTQLAGMSEYWLGMQGRITEPVYKAADSDHYVPIGWDEALDLVADRIRGLDSPDQAAFYTSGRITNEPAFLYQLLARALGTNNLPDCSNMCHEATGAGMSAAIGIGKSTVSYDDYGKADLILVMGQNPGTNHPRMLNALAECKENGGQVVGVNVMPEASLLRYKNPQKPSGLIGHGEEISDQFVHIRIGGDQHLLQAVAKRVLLAEAAAPGTVLDHDFIDRYCTGFEAYRDAILATDDDEVLLATGLTAQEIDELAQRYIASNGTIITWALGITQHKKAVETIQEAMNLLMLRGNIGKPGAGAAPTRGHSNVQGDRTMGIWEQMPEPFLAALEHEFAITVPREHGLDTVNSMNALVDGRLKVVVQLAGNLVSAVSDTALAERGMRNADLTVHVGIKLNRSHAVTGREALILPVLGRTEKDVRASGEQFTTVEDTVCVVNMSKGDMRPVVDGLPSDVAVICRLGERLVPHIPWRSFEDDYSLVRDAISRVIPGFEDFDARIRSELAFRLPHGPRDSRTFPTADGKAHFTVTECEHVTVPAGRLMLQSFRAHDQHNTTIYGLNDRYRGIARGRFVVFVNPADLEELGLADGQTVDVFSEWPGEPDRVLRGYRVVSYPTARGCAAMYFPEANAIIPRANVADGVNTPASKQTVVRLEPGTERVPGGVPLTV